MLLVVDTNIIVSAIKSPSKYDDNGNRILTKPQMLIRDILEGKHTIVVSKAIMKEYEDVLHRPLLALNEILVELFLSAIKLKAIWIEPLATTSDQIKMIDESDRIFFDVARCMNIKLISGNLRHFPVHELRSGVDELYS